MSPTRREFLGASAGLSAAAALGLTGCRALRGGGRRPYEISLAQWSLHRTIRAGELDNLDFPRAARRDYGVDAIEYVNQFFMDKATSAEYLAEMAGRQDDFGVAALLIMVDGEGALGAADAGARRDAVQAHHKWVMAAERLGCHSIRVNVHGEGTPDEQRERAAASLHTLATFGADHDIDIIVENHGGLSSDAAWLASVMRAADHPRVGTLPDFGNFHLGDGQWYDRYQGVAELMPWARAVSAKSHDFDADGDEVGTDYLRMLRLVVDAGYHGYVGIEYEGSALSERDGILATKALLERVRDQLV